MTLDHVGIASASLEARALFAELLGASPYRTETVEREGVTTVFFGDGGAPGAQPKLELLETDDDDSNVGKFLASRGPGVHHLAFEVPDVVAAMVRVRALGIRLLAQAPQPGADGKRIVFLHPKDTGGVLVELLDTPRRPRETRRIAGPAGEIAVHSSGDTEAPPLVVLHGTLGSTDLETDRLVRFWERRFHVHAVDFRGHGESASAQVPFTWDGFTDDAAAAIEALGLDRFRMFGFSLGGAAALGVAARLGDRVRRLAVHGVNVRWSQADVDAMTGAMCDIEATNPFWAKRLEETHGDGWRALVAQAVAFTHTLPRAHASDAMLQAVTAPTLVSMGDADHFFDVSHAVDLYRAIPHARLWILPGMDHPIQGLDAEAFAATVGDYLMG